MRFATVRMMDRGISHFAHFDVDRKRFSEDPLDFMKLQFNLKESPSNGSDRSVLISLHSATKFLVFLAHPGNLLDQSSFFLLLPVRALFDF